MRFASIALALVLSASAGAAVAGTVVQATESAPQSGVTREPIQRRLADCHRDVRTHRIYGAWIRHRHVGPDCDIREVGKSKTPLPKTN